MEEVIDARREERVIMTHNPQSSVTLVGRLFAQTTTSAAVDKATCFLASTHAMPQPPSVVTYTSYLYKSLPLLSRSP